MDTIFYFIGIGTTAVAAFFLVYMLLLVLVVNLRLTVMALREVRKEYPRKNPGAMRGPHRPLPPIGWAEFKERARDIHQVLGIPASVYGWPQALGKGVTMWAINTIRRRAEMEPMCWGPGGTIRLKGK